MPRNSSPQTQAQQWKQVKKSLHSQFHFNELRPGQEEVIRATLAGENALAIMPTGAGKSLCYQLPALQLDGTTVVVSPLISLMKDQREKVEEKGMAAVEINSTISQTDKTEGMDRVASEEAEILYVTPERFTQDEFIETMKSARIDFVVIDEAHCVSQWGHDFRPSYLAVGESIKKLGAPPVLALTATATEEVAQDIQTQLGLKELKVFRSSVLRENLHFEAQYLDKPQEKMEAALKLAQELKDSSGIIYTATVKAAKELHEYLAENGIESLLYHGKLKAKEREENQNEFMNHSPRLMIATNAFGMGIDKPDIRYVVHFQFPGSLEAYYQEAGRAGRDGGEARCILLYLKRDKSTQSLFLSGKYPSPAEVARVYAALQVAKKNQILLERKDLEAQFATVIAKTKISVIVALLKQLKVIGESKTSGLRLLKDDLSAVAVENLAQTYQERAERDRGKLDHVIKYAQSALCRWRNILQYFNEPSPEAGCNHCDNCLAPGRREMLEQLSTAATT